jgi:hypothetical protein
MRGLLRTAYVRRINVPYPAVLRYVGNAAPAIARLNAYSPAASFRSSNSLYSSYDIYSGASLVKVVGILI